MNERLEFSSKASFSCPLIGTIVPFNAVHRSSTEEPQLDEAASRCSLTTSQLRDHVFDWRSDPRADVSHQVGVDQVDDAGINVKHWFVDRRVFHTFFDRYRFRSGRTC